MECRWRYHCPNKMSASNVIPERASRRARLHKSKPLPSFAVRQRGCPTPLALLRWTKVSCTSGFSTPVTFSKFLKKWDWHGQLFQDVRAREVLLMRGNGARQEGMFRYVPPATPVLERHPLRPIR